MTHLIFYCILHSLCETKAPKHRHKTLQKKIRLLPQTTNLFNNIEVKHLHFCTTLWSMNCSKKKKERKKPKRKQLKGALGDIYKLTSNSLCLYVQDSIHFPWAHGCAHLQSQALFNHQRLKPLMATCDKATRCVTSCSKSPGKVQGQGAGRGLVLKNIFCLFINSDSPPPQKKENKIKAWKRSKSFYIWTIK